MSARSGARAERRARRILEAAGYIVTRAAGSRGLWDLVAIGPRDIRLVQVKAGTARLSPVEREQLQSATVPPNASREYWRFPPRARAPIIETL